MYKEPTLEPLGGGRENELAMLGVAFYFAFVVVAFYVAAAFSVAAAACMVTVEVGIPGQEAQK